MIYYKRVRTPTLIQMEATECGAASLGIILSYYKRFVTLEELRVACGVSRDGSTVYNLKEAARKYGLNARAFKKSMEELFELKPPFIVFWNYNHFLVVEGVSRKWVFLNDPASGPRRVSHEEFAQSYSEVVLIFEKTETFETGGRIPSIWPGVAARLKQVKLPVIYLLFAGFGIMLTGAFYPGFTKVFFDTILGENIYNWANWFIAGFFALVFLTGALIWLQQWLLIRLNSKLSIRFSSDYLSHILKLPLTFYQQRFGGEIAYRLSLNDALINTLTGKLATTFISMLFILFYASLMFALSPMIASIAVFSAVLDFLAVALIQRFRNDSYAVLQQDYGRFYGFAIGGLYYIESIKASGLESDFFSKLIGYFNKALNVEQKLGKKNAPVNALPIFLQLMTTSALFGIGGYLIMTENFTIGLFVALQVLISNFNTPVIEMTNLGEYIQTLKIDMARIDDVMKNPVDPLFALPAAPKGVSIKRLEGYLELSNLTFGYSPLAPPLLENFSLKLGLGQRVALVGGTGCGKTTIARLISGLLHPWKGEVRFDGKQRQELTREEIVASLATIDQEVFLFSGTVKENIALFDHTYTDDEIIRAAKDACIHEEILQKPKGYDYLLTEGGNNFSGGQRQRLEIARALLANPSILILDEATSALDAKVEEKIINNIRQRGCTCVMVAHRLSTIRDCDEIIVLEHGKVIQRGNHQILKEVPGPYRKLVLHDI